MAESMKSSIARLKNANCFRLVVLFDFFRPYTNKRFSFKWAGIFLDIIFLRASAQNVAVPSARWKGSPSPMSPHNQKDGVAMKKASSPRCSSPVPCLSAATRMPAEYPNSPSTSFINALALRRRRHRGAHPRRLLPAELQHHHQRREQARRRTGHQVN